MDTCGVFDTHNDLPWTYAKYQDPENPTISVPEPIGVDIDAPHMDLNSEKVLQGADKHTSKFLIRKNNSKKKILFGPFFNNLYESHQKPLSFYNCDSQTSLLCYICN